MASSRVMISGFLHGMATQLSSRLLTFAVNLLIARRVTPEAYGVTAIQFHLIITTILFLSREGFRRGCLRSDSVRMEGAARAQLLNTAWLTVPLGLAVSALVCGTVVYWQDLQRGSAHSSAVSILSGACFLELWSEPFYILAQNRLHFRLRAVVETSANIARCLATYLLIVYASMDSVVATAYAQLLFAAVVLAGYVWDAMASAEGGPWTRARSLFPSRPRDRSRGGGWFDSELLRLSGIFTVQALEKHVLAEGGKMVMTLVATRYNQGVYGLVSNLGSLVVRCALHPFEESAFTAFSKSGDGGDKGAPEVRRANGRLLQMMLKAVGMLGLVVAVFGPPFSYTLLRILYSDRWSETEAPAVLSMYCVFVLLMALNGVTEAFVHAVVTAKELGHANLWLVAFAAAHMALTYFFTTTFGSLGLVLANCCNMVIRIAYSSWFIARHLRGASPGRAPFTLRGAAPSARVAAMLGASGAAMHLSSRVVLDPGRFLGTAPVHVGVGVVALLCVGLVGVRSERPELLGKEE